MKGQEFTRRMFEQAASTCLHKGKWCNADCWLTELEGRWVVKDFRKLPWPLRWTLGVWFVRRELRFLETLADTHSVPGDSFLLDRFALAERFVEGRPLKTFSEGELAASFFEEAEALLRAVHKHDVVHLDLRNAGNLQVTADHHPVLLDFQAAISTRHLPASVRWRLEQIDLSGIYKHWAKIAPGTLGEARERVLLWQLRARKWWRIRGYQGFSLHPRRLKRYELALLRKSTRA